MGQQDGRRKGSQAQEAIRLLVVDFLRQGKGTQAEAASIFQLSTRAIRKIWQRYKQGGRKSLLAKKRGPVGSTSRLDKEQVKQIKVAIRKATPDYYGLGHYLWTAGAVGLLIKKNAT